MQFQETGLPLNPMVYKAYTIHVKNLQIFPQFKERDDGLRMAQLLSQTTGSSELVSLALLRGISGTAWKLAGKYFGTEITLLNDEVNALARARFADIAGASTNAKCFVLAADIASMANYLEKIGETGLTAQSGKKISIPNADQLKDFEKTLSDVRGTTSSPELEGHYLKMLNRMQGFRRSVVEEMREMGIMAPGVPETFPPLGEINLIDNEQVAAAYGIITKDKRLKISDFDFAVDVAEILSTETENPDPAAIAAALVDIGIAQISEKDLSLWEDEIGDEAAGIISRQRLQDIRSAEQILNQPENFRQMAIAFYLSEVESLYGQVKEDVEITENIEDEFRANAEEITALILQDTNVIIDAIESIISPVLGQSGSPRLENLFNEKLKELKDLVVPLLPKKKQGPKPPPSEYTL